MQLMSVNDIAIKYLKESEKNESEKEKWENTI